MGGEGFEEGTAGGDFGGFPGGEGAAGFDRFTAGELAGELAGEGLGIHLAFFLHIDDMRREAALLVPGDDVIGGAGDEVGGVFGLENFAGDEGEAQAAAVTEEAHLGWQLGADGGEGLIAAGGGEGIRLGVEGVFERAMTAAPFGDFEAGTQFAIVPVNGMDEETRQERPAGGALHELRRAEQQPEREAHHGGNRQIAGGDVGEEMRADGEGEIGRESPGRCRPG